VKVAIRITPRYPAWFMTMAKRPDDSWLEIGKERFKVRGESLEGSERSEARARAAAIGSCYGSYQERIDRGDSSSPAHARAVVIRLARRELPTTGTPIFFRTR
jgi:hypothetical protein